MYFPNIEDIVRANIKLKSFIDQTPLMLNHNLSNKFGANVWLKREDLQIVRSYKIRGAYNKISSLSDEERERGVVCASAGNHAQGVAFSCNAMKIHGKIFMPVTTPGQKVKQVKMFGKEYTEIVLVGDTFDEAFNEAVKDCKENNMVFVPPFNDEKVIEGQGTVALELLEQTDTKIDYIFVPIGGGGLASGVGAYIKRLSPDTKVIGVEPSGAPTMKTAVEQDHVVTLQHINKFVDGAAVQTAGELTFEICKQVIDDFVLVPEGKVCTEILRLYNEDAVVAEPAGALSLAALDFYKDKIKGKNVVCIVSGGNNDLTRIEETKERSLLYEGYKHYFLIEFAQRAGALKDFVLEVMGPDDDIALFEYSKKNSRGKGPALVGIEVKNPDDINRLKANMDRKGLTYQYLNDRSDLFQYLI
mgnify:CR=1 FL=1